MNALRISFLAFSDAVKWLSDGFASRVVPGRGTASRSKTVAKPLALATVTLLLATLPAFAQNSIQATLNINPPYSTLVSDYITNFNRAITLQLVNTGNVPLDVRLSGTLRGSSGVTVFIPDDLGTFKKSGGQPIAVAAKQAKLIRSIDIQNAFGTDPSINNSTANLRPALISNLVLPEGDYELCVKVFDANSNQQLADVACAYFSISNIEPPYLLSPQDKDPMTTATATYQPVQFQWTYPAGATPTKIEYVLQVAELRAGQNAYNLFQSGPPFAEIVIPTSNPIYILKPTDPRLEVGRTYAWRVQVRGKGTNAGLVNFQNNGYSTVNTFTYGSGTPDLVTSSDALTSTKSTPVVNNIGGQCACKFDKPTDARAVSDLTNSKTVFIGGPSGYQLSISELSANGDKYTGTGMVALSPDFKPTGRSGLFIPVKVTFNDVQVNAAGVMLSGQVQSAKNAGGLPSLIPGLPASPTAPNLPTPPDPAALLLTAKSWTQIRDKIVGEANGFVQNATDQATQQVNQQRNGAGFETPFGYSSDLFTLAVDNLIFTATSAQFDAMTVIEDFTGATKLSIPLGVKGACMPMANCQSNSVLYLLKDMPLGETGLTLKGGTDAANSTYYTFNLNKDKAADNELTVAVDYTIPKATPVTGSGPVVVKLRTKTKNGFDNWKADATVSDEFKLDGIDDFTFALKKATYDHDSNSNPDGFDDMIKGLTSDGVEAGKLANLQKDVWKGFFMNELTISLPGVFQKKGGSKTSVRVRNLLIDGHLGLSGSLGAENVIKYEDGSLDGWYFSLDKIGITFFDGVFIKANAHGKIGLPISDGKEQSALVYTNTLTQGAPGEGLNYLFLVEPDKDKDIDVPIWAAKFTLSETSTIQVTIGKTTDNPAGGTWAGADLSGKISINPDYLPSAVRSSGLPTFSLNLMSFEHLKIQSKGPNYIDWGTYKSDIYDDAGKAVKSSPFAGAFASPQKSIMGLPISIDDYGPVIEGSNVGFKFTATMSLSDIPAVPKASATIRIMANIGIKDGRPNWRFDNIYLDSIAVAGTIGPVTVAGSVAFYRKDGAYGDGLYGKLAATFPLDIAVGAEARFGTVNNTSYWYVSAKATGLAVAVGPGVLITGFGGGAYHNMTAPPTPKADQLLAKAPLQYKVQDGINGFQASVYLSSADGAAPGATGAILKADGTLTVQFDKDWGLDLIEIKANAHLICNVPGASDKPSQGMADGTGVISYKVPDKMFNLGVQVKASVADMIDLNAWLAVHVGPDGYYIKVGEPANRVKVILKAPGLDISLGEATAYFVMGTLDMPNTLPDPIGIDPDLLAQVGYHKPAVDFKSGLAFGSALDIGSKDKHRFLIFYLKLHAGIGFDVIMGKTEGNCSGAKGGGQPGINGYYAMGQIYAGVEFNFGVGVDLWFVSGDFDVATVRAGAIFMGGLPNPTWLRGILYGQYDILDGLVSGSMSFRLKIGDVCMPDTETNPFKMPLVASVSPTTGDKNVSILKNPVVTFNYPVNQDICVSKPINENGDLGTDCYKVEFSLATKCGDQVSNSGNNTCTDCNEEVIPNDQIFFSQRGTEATFYKEKAFSPDRKYTFTVKAIAYRKKYGETNYTRFRDTLVTVSFTSGECIKTLSRSGADKTIAASYPFLDQRFLLQKEYGGRGFIQLVQDFSCCLRGNESLVKTVAEFSDAFGGAVLSEAPVTFEGKLLRFDIPTLPHEKVIQVRILQKPTEQAQQQANQQAFSPGIQGGLGTGNNYVGATGSGVNSANSYAGTTSSGVQFADGKNRDGAAPAASKGTVVSNAASSYQLVRDASSQRLTPVLKPIVLTAYYFRTSRYDTWATKLADRKQDRVEGPLYAYPTIPKMEMGSFVVDLAEEFDVFDMGESAERIDINVNTAYGRVKNEIQYPALLTMQEPSKTISYEGVSFRMTNNGWFNTHALPIYKQAIHLQRSPVLLGMGRDLSLAFNKGAGVVRVSSLGLNLMPKPPLQATEKPFILSVVGPTFTTKPIGSK